MQTTPIADQESGASSSEEWRAIPGHEDYEVSDRGRVRRLGPARGAVVGSILKPKRKKGQDHLYVDLSCDDVATRIGVHRLMAIAFLGPPPSDKHQAAHWNGRGDDNRLDNIRWATPGENAEDKHRHGTDRRGERHPLRKLTTAQVLSVRKLRDDGATFKEIAARFGVSDTAIRDIYHGRKWAHLAKDA